MTASDLELIHKAALEAGELARTFKREGQVKTWSKDGGSPVTNGDLAVDEWLTQTLRGAAQQVEIVGVGAHRPAMARPSIRMDGALDEPRISRSEAGTSRR